MTNDESPVDGAESGAVKSGDAAAPLEVAPTKPIAKRRSSPSARTRKSDPKSADATDVDKPSEVSQPESIVTAPVDSSVDLPAKPIRARATRATNRIPTVAAIPSHSESIVSPVEVVNNSESSASPLIGAETTPDVAAVEAKPSRSRRASSSRRPRSVTEAEIEVLGSVSDAPVQPAPDSSSMAEEPGEPEVLEPSPRPRPARSRSRSRGRRRPSDSIQSTEVSDESTPLTSVDVNEGTEQQNLVAVESISLERPGRNRRVLRLHGLFLLLHSPGLPAPKRLRALPAGPAGN